MKEATVERPDLPAEWAQSPAPDVVGTAGDDSRYGECLGRPDPKTVRTATKASDVFRLGDGMIVSSTARTLPKETDARADFVALRGDRGPLCLRQRLKNELDRRRPPGGVPSNVTVERLPGLEFGDETVAFRATLDYPAVDGSPKMTYVDVVNVRKGTLELALTLSSTQQPFPSDLQRGLLTKVVGRI